MLTPHWAATAVMELIRLCKASVYKIHIFLNAFDHLFKTNSFNCQ